MSNIIEKKELKKSKLTSSNVKSKLIWDQVTDKDRRQIEEVSSEYRDFLTEAKTERKVIARVISELKKSGFKDLTESASNGSGWLLHHGKLLGIFVPGKEKVQEGFNLLVVHGDAPRLDLKPRAIYEDCGFGLLKTNLYGGLKKFQWLTRPLALWGFCVLKDGRKVDLKFGEDLEDPVLTITDILPHLDRKVQREKKLIDAFPAEKLNLLVASSPNGSSGSKNRFKSTILKILKNKWGIQEDDLISSEIEIVPAGPAREVGLDGSMIGGYAQDDRLSVFASVKALLGIKKPQRPLLLVVFDREEIGSYGSTGAESNFIQRLVAEAFKVSGQVVDWHQVQSALANTRALSADVEAGQDPTFKEVHDDLNAARLGFGPCLVRYTGGVGKSGASEAGAEYMALIRRIFDKDNISWQSTLLGKQEEGGGGTVALSLASHGISIVDCGAPLLSMHSPFEISSKADVWMTIRAITSFFQNA